MLASFRGTLILGNYHLSTCIKVHSEEFADGLERHHTLRRGGSGWGHILVHLTGWKELVLGEETRCKMLIVAGTCDHTIVTT